MTGTRADFGKLRPLIDKVDQSSNFTCYIFITGMHTLSKYGGTYEEVQKCGYKNTFIYMNQTHTTDQDIILANTITGFGNFVKEISPDMIVIHGDRVETLAGAIVGSLNNILVAHIEGGEVSGTIDESIRHAVTKLSHIHFVSNNDAKQRLIQMGETQSSIFIIGSPDIEVMKNSNLPLLEKVKRHYEIKFDNYSIMIFHPVAAELNILRNQIKQIVTALMESQRNYIIIYPNNDAGSDIILDEIKKVEGHKHFKIFPSIRFHYFLTLLKNSKFIIGNSSVGIREAEVYGIPAINIGSRQKNRTKNKDIININATKRAILNAIKISEQKKFEPHSYFSSITNSSEKFLQLLNDGKIWNVAIQKQFVDLTNLNSSLLC